MLLVPDKLRQDRVFAISPGLFLLSVNMLLREAAASVAWEDENEKKEDYVSCGERSGHSVTLLRGSFDNLGKHSTKWHSWREALMFLKARALPQRSALNDCDSSLTALCNRPGTVPFSSMSSGSSTAYPLRTNSNPILSSWEEKWKGNHVLSVRKGKSEETGPKS